MRTLEWLMVVLSIPAIGWALRSRRAWPLWIRLAALMGVLLLPLHVLLEKPHWQMIPIYIGLLLLLCALLLQHRDKTRTRLSLVAGVLMLAGVAICLTLPMFHLPRPTGPYAVGTSTFYFVDPNRQESHPHAPHIAREVVVQVWYPSATASGKHAMYREWKETDPRSTYQAVLPVDGLADSPVASGRFPVVLFNHAWRGFRNRSTYIMQELASQGFVVVGISHPWNSAIVELHDGRVADGRGQVDLGNFYAKPPMTLEQRLALSKAEMRIQTDDDKFLLDQLELLNQPSDGSKQSPLAGHLDLAHVGAFGHSFGGAVSAELANEDSRVISAIVLDGVLTGPVAVTGLNKPLFRLMAEAAFMPAGSENSPVQSTRVHAQMSQMGEKALANSFQKFGGYEVVIRGIDHENFSDKGFFSPFHYLSGIGEIPQPRAAQIIDAYVVAFFKQTLRGEPQTLLSNAPAPFPEVIHFKSWPRPQSPSQTPADAVAHSLPQTRVGGD